MHSSIREQLEAREADLSPFAARAIDSEGRKVTEEPDPIRTVYMRDRDRILHSKPFRRLKHKTQVFIDPVGDHYRTRLTHTLEVAQIARTIGRSLRLNEDLIEAIALAHDVGHTPFGHAGEHALDEALAALQSENGPHSFSHSEQSLRIVEILTPLNLTRETLAGIGGHSKGRKDLSSHDGERISTLEAAVVRISDRIAYLNHDLDDALRSGILDSAPSRFDALGATHGDRISLLLADVIEQSTDRPQIRMSQPLLDRLNDLKEFLFDEVYTKYPILYPDISKAKLLVKELFAHYLDEANLPEGFVGVQGAVDYVAGMTDRFALERFAQLRLPRAWPIP